MCLVIPTDYITQRHAELNIDSKPSKYIMNKVYTMNRLIKFPTECVPHDGSLRHRYRPPTIPNVVFKTTTDLRET